MILPSFCAGSYETEAVTADAEKTVNWIPTKLEAPGATTQWALYPTPGVTRLSAASSGPGRGHFFFDDREFAVIGTTLYEIDSSGTQLTSRGSVALGANPATISSNGDGGGQLFITSGNNGYVFDLGTNVLSQIAALNGIATMGDHLDGYFLALDAATSKLYVSALLDGTTWSTGTDFAQRSIQPDPWVSMIVSSRYIWLFGKYTTEVWYNTGESFPFAPHPSGLIPIGCAAAFTPEVMGQDTIWLGTDRDGGIRVVRASGFTPETISDQPTQRFFGEYAQITDAVADVYNERGHAFYLLTFPTQNVTWCWDRETRLWHERGSWSPANNRFEAWRPRWHAYAFGQHRMLDATTGAVYHMASTLSMDVDGMAIRRLRRSAALMKENLNIIYPGFELDLEVGLADASGDGSNPHVMMRFSGDGGKTWSNERMRSAGRTGEYGHRVRWTRLGQHRRMVFEVSVTDPVAWRITNAYLYPEPIVCDGKVA
jgi:hypothetical protein